MENDKLEIEWCTASTAKSVFGIGFARLMKLADEEIIECKQLPADDNGDVTFLFRARDIRSYIESV